MSPGPSVNASRRLPAFRLLEIYDSQGKISRLALSGEAGHFLLRKTAGQPVYKARERIHRNMADLRLLAIPASCGRVADHNPNWDRLWWD